MHIPRKPSPVLSLDGYASSIIIEISRTRSFPNRPIRDSSSFQVPPVGLEPMTIGQTDESDPIIPDPARLLLLYSMTIAARIRISYKART